MLLDQEDPAHDGPGGTLRLLCFPCFVEDDGKNVHTKELYKNVQKRIKASCGRKHWGDTSWEGFVKHCKRSWERRKAKLRDCHRRTGYTNLQDWWNDIEFNDLLPKGISNTQKRKFILLNTVTIAEVWETGFKKLPKEKQVAFEQVFERDEKRRNNGRGP